MRYKITYNGSPLTSADGYRWKAPEGADIAGQMAARIVNDAVEFADHHDPIQVILERLGEAVEVESVPAETSGDVVG